MSFDNKGTFIKKNGEIASLILAKSENMASVGMHLIQYKQRPL